MTKETKLRWIVAGPILGFLIIGFTIQTFYKRAKLDECSFFTIAKVTKIKYRNFHASIIYQFRWKGKLIENDDPANPTDTGEWIYKDTNELINRRFWVQVNCEYPRWHILLWDVAVPDTLKIIPLNGWVKLPQGLKPYVKPQG